MSGFSIDHIKKAVETISKSGFGDFMNQAPSNNKYEATQKHRTSENREQPTRKLSSGKSEPWRPVENSGQCTTRVEQQTTNREKTSQPEKRTDRKPMDWNKFLF